MPRQLTVQRIPSNGKPGQVYYPLRLAHAPKPSPGPGQVLVRLEAAALNHRDVFIRQHLYPSIGFDTSPLLADGCGRVEAVGPGCASRTLDLLRGAPGGGGGKGARVLLTPSRGWDAAPDGPEDPARFAVVGGGKAYPDQGAAQDYVVVPEGELEPCPEHLTAVQAAALPLVGLTGWRALVTKAGVSPAAAAGGSGGGNEGKNILITGIGGGVALQTLQFAVALGCRVWVTSGSEAKLSAARRLGAAGGVLYTSPTWHKDLQALLRSATPRHPVLDAVIDGAGGDVVARTTRLLRPGGVIACYGMTTAPRMDWTMAAVLANVELRGTTMGSRAEFAAMVAFVRERKIVPVVSRVARGLGDLAAVDGLFADMRDGRQFGKLVIEIDDGEGDGDGASKL